MDLVSREPNSDFGLLCLHVLLLVVQSSRQKKNMISKVPRIWADVSTQSVAAKIAVKSARSVEIPKYSDSENS